MIHAAIDAALWVVLSFAVIAAWIACCEVVRRLDARRARARFRLAAANAAEERLYPEPGAEWPGCGCKVYFDNEGDRAVWITCGYCRPAGRHHIPADIVTATLDQLEEWRRQ